MASEKDRGNVIRSDFGKLLTPLVKMGQSEADAAPGKIAAHQQDLRNQGLVDASGNVLPDDQVDKYRAIYSGVNQIGLSKIMTPGRSATILTEGYRAPGNTLLTTQKGRV